MVAIADVHVWLNLVSDLTICRGFTVGLGLQHTPTLNVTVAPYAQGNYRDRRSPGIQQTSQATLGFLTNDDVAWLRLYEGEKFWYRDPTGLKFPCIYGADSPAFVPDPSGGYWSATLTLQQVTVSEAV